MTPHPSAKAQVQLDASAAKRPPFVRRSAGLAAAVLGMTWAGLAPSLAGTLPDQRGALRWVLIGAAGVLILGCALLGLSPKSAHPTSALPVGPSLPLRGMRGLAGFGAAIGTLVALGWAWRRSGIDGAATAQQEGLALAAALIGLSVAASVGLGWALFRRQSSEAQAEPTSEPEASAGEQGTTSGQYTPLPPRSPAAYPVASYVALHSLSAAGLTLAGWLLCAGYILGLPGLRTLGTSLVAAAPGVAVLAVFLARLSCRAAARDLRTLTDELNHLGLLPAGSAPTLAAAVAVTRRVKQLYTTLDELRAQLNQHLAAYDKELRLAEEADRRRTEFISDVGRELRVPVQVLLAEVDRLLGGEDGELTDRQREAAEVLHKSTTQLQTLLAEVFDAAVLEGGLRLGKRSPVNVGGVARELLRLLRPLVSGGQVRLRLQVDPRTPPAFADALAVRRILGNLVSNAVKFTAEGEIVVALRPLPESDAEGQARLIEVQVRDTGPGIASGEVDRLFEEFNQGSTPHRSQAHGGIGLGLAIARRLTELHGGQITATSAPGSGATFTFTLPAATLDNVAESEKAPAWGALRADSPTVLPAGVRPVRLPERH